MEESFSSYGYASAKDADPPTPKTNETRIVEALESIASELFHIRRRLESVTDGDGDSDLGYRAPAIRTTGR